MFNFVKTNKYMKKHVLKLTITLWIGCLFVKAQESVNASGSDASGIGGSVSYSIGQTVYVSKSSSNYNLIEGVQQPYEISIITSKPSTENIDLTIEAYPNPTSNILTLRVTGILDVNFIYELYDVQGRILESGSITNEKTEISMEAKTSSMYYLNVKQKGETIKTFKIIKN